MTPNILFSRISKFGWIEYKDLKSDKSESQILILTPVESQIRQNKFLPLAFKMLGLTVGVTLPLC